MTSLAQIKGWSKKYPFDEGELEIILRCYSSITSPRGEEKTRSFLALLAHSFPYVFFFLPTDEILNRIKIVEENILPENFGDKLKHAIFPLKGNETEQEAIELLIQGFANSCRGDSKDTLGVIFDCCNLVHGTTNHLSIDIIQLCYTLSISAQVLVSPKIDKEHIVALSRKPAALHGLVKSLDNAMRSQGKRPTKDIFIDWGLKCVPHIGSTLTAFMYNIVFHGKSKHSKETMFSNPELQDTSLIFNEDNAYNLFAISCMSPDLGGKWRRLFSSDQPDSSISSLEGVMVHHVGPSVFVIKVGPDHIIGGCAESGWKFGYFVFEIEPLTRIHKSKGAAGKYFVKHDVKISNEHGEELTGAGFYADGGTNPELFMSEHFNWCKGNFLDVPFASKVECFEVWGIELPKKISVSSTQ
mmetsp:Transcript_1692/g.2515  ORF Transcript_1692/g.2515 Transcript_1692/m.2515 type:complete len:413 (-) Transcript_1692:92-1330(-)|eukprot:CAMPEP_0197241892 /NCGR_PEP_ID=MMETSP1429-20130617/7794_1 /TAXON_ID=49237 /ORGANISM="Chaetoceros  sp., Strain UNC1202" /LENGTH=412 /DNA_ID=CAMNT_0042701807 /DNA_START=859 /DNA_END=2097 /DNA_ORIENTATION=+